MNRVKKDFKLVNKMDKQYAHSVVNPENLSKSNQYKTRLTKNLKYFVYFEAMGACKYFFQMKLNNMKLNVIIGSILMEDVSTM